MASIAATGKTRIMILGIGNILWGDEGFGVRAVEELHRRYELPETIEVLDGGTQGLYLLNMLEGITHLLVFDAIDYGMEPGTLKLVFNDEVPKFTGAKKMSLHQTGFQEVLSAADLMGYCPPNLALVGCQPLDLENWGGPLTEPVRLTIAPALEAAVRIISSWGVDVHQRADTADVVGLLGNDIDFEAYERRVEA